MLFNTQFKCENPTFQLKPDCSPLFFIATHLYSDFLPGKLKHLVHCTNTWQSVREAFAATLCVDFLVRFSITKHKLTHFAQSKESRRFDSIKHKKKTRCICTTHPLAFRDLVKICKILYFKRVLQISQQTCEI